MSHLPRTRPLRAALDQLESRVLMTAQALAGSADLQLFEQPGFGQPAELSNGDDGVSLSEIHARSGVQLAHEQYGLRGTGQTVVVIDSGIAYDHQSLGGGLGPAYRVVGGRDFTEENDADPYDDGPAGFHGTHVAGIIASDDATHTGVAPDVDLIGLRVFNDQGRGRLSWLEESLQWVLDNADAFEHPITTVNLSIGTQWNATTLPDYARLEDEFAALAAADIFVSVAAGNRFDATQPGLSYPAVSPHVTPVASANLASDTLSQYSQRDTRVLVATGENVISTVPDYLDDFNGQADDYYAVSGTSMAAPYIAGASVLVRQAMTQAGQTADVASIRNVLHTTADAIYDASTGKTYHSINVGAAIRSVLGPPQPAAAQPGGDAGSDTPASTPEQAEPAPTQPVASPRPPATAQPQPPTQQGPARPQPSSPAPVSPNPASPAPRPSWLQETANTFFVNGTPNDDTVIVDIGAGRLHFNGEQHPLPSGKSLVLRGQQGQDELTVRLPQGQAQLHPGSVTITNADRNLSASGWERIEVLASGDHVRAKFVGGSGADQFTTKHTHSWMQGDVYLNYVRGAQQVTAISTDQLDSVLFYDSPGVDRFTARPESATMSGGYQSQAFGFTTVVLRDQQLGSNAGNNTSPDRVTLVGSSGDDRVQVTDQYARMIRPDSVVFVTGATNLTTVGNGGHDSARLYDSPHSDKITFQHDVQELQTPDRIAQLREFSRVDVFAGRGNDRLHMYGRTENDRFNAKPTHSWLESQGSIYYAAGVTQVEIVGSGQQQTAALYDTGTGTNDTLSLSEKTAQLDTNNWRVTVRNVPSIRARSLSGHDQIRLVDGAVQDPQLVNVMAARFATADYTLFAEGFDVDARFSLMPEAVFADGMDEDLLTELSSDPRNLRQCRIA